jgi:hypothetical protein
VKARIWKDRETGMWFFNVRNADGSVSWYGKRRHWELALLEVLPFVDAGRRKP